MGRNNLQTNIATGRFTFPVVVFVCLLLWSITIQDWEQLGSLGIIALTGYLMIETNTAFTLIRTRTTLPVCIFWYLMTSFIFFHPFDWKNSIPLLFSLSIYPLFLSYESSSAPTEIFHSFFFLGLGSLLFPQFLFYVPLFLLSTISFRSLSFKSLLAGLLGLATPYWFLFGHAFYHDQMPLFYQPFHELAQFTPIVYSCIPTHEWISWIATTIISLGCILHYLQVSYQDKTRTRIYLSFIVAVGIWTILLIILQPQYLHILMPIQLISTSFLASHSFILTQNRLSGILFIVTFVVFILLMFFNLWMQFFNS